MIKQVILKNFQAHKDLTIDFTDGVNCVIGASDTGKSAVVRAIEWVAFNRPSGDAMKRWGSKFVEVTIITDEHTITRRKDNSFNGYYLNGEEFAAVNRTVPEAVQNALNLKEINVQGQFSPPFLLAASSSEVGRQLNDLVDLTIIDTTISAINKKVRDASKTISVLEATEQQQKEILNRFKGIRTASAELKDLKTAHNIYSGTMAKSLKIEAILRQSYKYVESVKDKALIISALSTMDEIAEESKAINAKNSQIISLQRLIDRYNGAVLQQSGLQEVKDALEALSEIQKQEEKVDERRKEYNRINKAVNVYSETQKRLGVLGVPDDALRSIQTFLDYKNGLVEAETRALKLEQTIKRLNRAKELLKVKTQAEKEFEGEHKALLGENCPLCGSRVDSSVESCSGC